MHADDDRRDDAVSSPSARHADEFRRETADCMISTGRPITQRYPKLGLNSRTVGKRVQDRRRELEMENAFLKKAAAFFAKGPGSPRATGRCWRRGPNARSR